MPLPSQIQLSNTFGQWVNATNDIITAVGNTSEYILVAQNATPAISTGNVSINGVMTLASLKANGALGSAGQFLTSNGNNVYWSTLVVVDATNAASGLVNTTAQNFAGNKTFEDNITFQKVSTLTSLKANGALGAAGQFLTSNGNNVYWSTLTVVDATNTTSGLMNTAAQNFAGNKTFDNNVAITGYLTVGNSTITLNSTTLIVGNAASNVVINSSSVSLDGNQVINSSGTANNASNLNGQPASYYTNASNISTGTLAIARLDANVILTTSTTGMNASALSTGTVPLAQLTSANSSANGVVDTTTQTFAGNKTFNNNLTVSGNLTVLGTTTTVSANNLIVDDSLIQLAANNTTNDALDIGLYGNYNADGGAHEHTGLFRDATDGTWRLFVGLQESPTTTVNTAGTGYGVGTLVSYLSSGILSTNSTQLLVAANGSYSANLTVNTVTAQTFTGNLTGTASNATNLNSQTGSYYTNASNITTGTLPLAQLNANVLLTTSTTGINASALSTGTVPDARIAGAYTNVTSLALGANVVANVTTVFVGNSTANVVHTATSLSVANSTNTATLTPISLTIGTQVANTVGFYSGANVYANNTTVFVGNSTINLTLTSTPTFNGNTSTGVTANCKITLNTTNGRFVLPVGTNLWAL